MVSVAHIEAETTNSERRDGRARPDPAGRSVVVTAMAWQQRADSSVKTHNQSSERDGRAHAKILSCHSGFAGGRSLLM